jgi:hypothetical protein
MGRPKKAVSAGLIQDMKPKRGRKPKATMTPFPAEIYVAMDSGEGDDSERLDLEASVTPINNQNISYYTNVAGGKPKRMAVYVLKEVCELQITSTLNPIKP